MSNTPRTNAAVDRWNERYPDIDLDGDDPVAEESRKLEIELADAKATKDLWKERYEHLVGIDPMRPWQCGCGHWNGCNLATCADCGRKPGEK